MMRFKRIAPALLALLCLIFLAAACTGFYDMAAGVPSEPSAPVLTQAPAPTPGTGQTGEAPKAETLPQDGVFTSKEDVALYLFTYGKLPGNFITKTEARALGWSGGPLKEYAPGKCIGGDCFGNYEGALPEKDGRTYCECDIDTLGASSRGAKRIVFSNDGLIYYTADHYETFRLLYGEDG